MCFSNKTTTYRVLLLSLISTFYGKLPQKLISVYTLCYCNMYTKIYVYLYKMFCRYFSVLVDEDSLFMMHGGGPVGIPPLSWQRQCLAIIYVRCGARTLLLTQLCIILPIATCCVQHAATLQHTVSHNSLFYLIITFGTLLVLCIKYSL